MAPEPQRDVIQVLSTPATYGPGIDRVERAETHISELFVAGDRAYKLKRAVRLPFLDFTPLEARRRACLAELAVNRRTAPNLYLEVVPVTREADGALKLGGRGEPVDWVVVMARLEPDALFDRLAAKGGLTRQLAESVADAIAEFHATAERRPEWGGEAGLQMTIDTNAQCFATHIPSVFDPVAAGRVTEGSLAWLIRHARLVEQRRMTGSVRHCHGDLHLGNICLFEGRPTLFDAIEFNEDFASVDVLYDLAFLIMDLVARGYREAASRVLNRYLDQSGDLGGLPVLPLFLSLRAAIRAHVAAETARSSGEAAGRDEAVRYLDLAAAFLSPPSPRLVAVGGLSGSGKSRVARLVAPRLDAGPGAVVLRSDVIRKRLLGVSPQTRLPPTAYGEEMTERTYRTLYEDAARVLQSGHSVIADAVFARPEQRAAIKEVARRHGARFEGLWLEADPAAMRERVAARRGDASDATVAVLEQQLSYDLGPIGWDRVDSTGRREATLAKVLTALQL